MKKRTNTISEVHRDVLVKTKEQFKNELDARLEAGLELLKRQVNNPVEFGQSMTDFNSWDDYNEELLKQSFDRPNNDYHRDYTYSGIHFGVLGGPALSFQERIKEHKYDIEKQYGRLKLIRDKVDLIDTLVIDPTPAIKVKDEFQITMEKLDNLFIRFHKIAQTLRNRYKNRPTLLISDEYDVQDLLRALLKEHFNDIRDEEYVPSYAGANSRVDFLLKNEKIVIETKMTNEKLRDKEVGGQLLIDIGRYKSHPDCKVLILFIYDRGDFINNKGGLIRDLNHMSTDGIRVYTFISPE